MQSQPPPKGSLEELFRHHLLESEAAAVPPRPLVWDHIDTGLLQAQNEKYRRRLLVHRWGMAASLLLATLAGGGWWHSQQVATATLASANMQSEAARRAVAGAVANSPRTYTQAASVSTAASGARRIASPAEAKAVVTGKVATSNAAPAQAGQLTLANTVSSRPASQGESELATGSLASASAGAGTGSARALNPAAGVTPITHTAFSSSKTYAIAATATSSSATTPRSLASTAQPDASTEALLTDASLAVNRLGEAMLASRLASLAVAPAAGLPTELAMKELPTPAPTMLRRWRYGAAYTIGAFQPNIDFNRSSSTYNTALGLNTVSLTQAAAAEYRANLRPGLSQRLSLHATRWLGGHWSLSTGLEVAQQEAYSATSAAFTGEQLADLSNNYAATPSTSPINNMSVPSRTLHDSFFRYRSAGVPVELQYDNQTKSGLSFYGRLGAVVSALLNVRSEVAGNVEATRTYSLTSASSPYRRLTALLRGSAGVRYRPAGRTWGLHMGPAAEAGVQSMNAETDRSFLQQSRPYSVGIEAGIEFGGFKPVQ